MGVGRVPRYIQGDHLVLEILQQALAFALFALFSIPAVCAVFLFLLGLGVLVVLGITGIVVAVDMVKGAFSKEPESTIPKEPTP